MIHPASRLEVVIHSRADGRNAVKSAAYTARAHYRDAESGIRFRSSKKSGLLSHELINWKGTAEELWTAAELAENRGNARVIREIRPSLPHELSIDQQINLVRGFCLWLRDTYSVAVQSDVHAPRFINRGIETKHQHGRLSLIGEEYRAALFDKTKTNLNFHAHILMTTREVDRKTGAVGAKTRILDDRKTGPEEIQRIRHEWQKRTNSALKKAGSISRIDMRSYKEMAKMGDAPEGLVAQEHLGPRRAERSRKMEEKGVDRSLAGRKRRHAQKRNRSLWTSWLQLRALERQKLREEESVRIARVREKARRSEILNKSQALMPSSETPLPLREERAPSEAWKGRISSEWEAAITDALNRGSSSPNREMNEFDEVFDIETYEPKFVKQKYESQLKPIKIRTRQRVL